MPDIIFGQASKVISVVFGLKLFWRKNWGKTYLVLLEVKTGGWENLFASMEKHACFWRINKNGWSYLGPATSVKLIWWSDNSFLHANTPSPSQDLSPGCSWTTTIRKLKCLSLAKFSHTESIYYGLLLRNKPGNVENYTVEDWQLWKTQNWKILIHQKQGWKTTSIELMES